MHAINKLTGEQFEIFLEKILHKIGFDSIERTRLSGDFGADLIASRDGKKFCIQAKRYNRPVGNKAVQEVFSSMPIYKADSCMVISNQEFTNAAKKQALECKCILFGRKELQALLNDNFLNFNELINFLCNEEISKFKISNNQLIDAYFSLKKELSTAVRIEDMESLGLYSSSVYRRRWGSWNSFLKSIDEPVTQEKSIKKDVLLDEFRRVQKLLGKVPTRSEMSKHANFSVSTFERSFGSWNKVIESVGGKVNKKNNIPKNSFIVEFKRVKQLLGHTPSSAEMSKHGSVAPSSYKRIWGSWSEFLKESGEPYQKRNISDEELVMEYLKLKKLLKKTSLTQKDMNEFGKYSSSVYERRYGNWNKFLNTIGDKLNLRTDISKEELINEYFRIKAELGKIRLSANDIKLNSTFSLSAYLNKFRTWNEFLREINEIN
ncbi:homing endonuclease associated repeat-containing protein [Methylomonas sp. BW4-1]|uniref:homing endonuclease associated repeat-containing protein n=1 Tax=Methylomonas sp. BW4-1 TaxID=3376685 RepID=UPI0040428AB2